MDIINNRRSVRKFKQEKVEPEKIEKLLRAGMQAPSAVNQQPWEFVVVQDEDLRYKISKTSKYSGMVKDAPLVIVVLCNANGLINPSRIQQDLGACTQNILLEAVSLNLGATWVGVFPDEEKLDYLHTTLDMPENVYPYCIIAAGYPLDENANKYKDRYDASRIHMEKY